MATNRKRTPRLGRGLSSLMATPVQIDPPEAAPEAAPEASPEAPQQTSPEVSPEAPPAALSDAGAGDAVAGAPEQAGNTPDAESASTSGVDAVADGDAGVTDGIARLPLDAIVPNPSQPRQHFDESALAALARSIRAEGVMQPIVVRPAPGEREQGGGGGQYELVAGERRWRAARLAGLGRIPAIVRELDDQRLAEWALIENLQREDLNPMERAEAFASLAQRFSLSHDAVAERVGLERSTVSNLLRLLNLHENVRQYVRDGLLSMGQSRALAGLGEASAQQALADRVVREGMSVRRVESAVRQANQAGHAESAQGVNKDGKGGQPADKSGYLKDLEHQIAEQLGTRVTIKPARKKGAGTLSIEFYSLDQFDDLLGRLGVRAE